MNNFHIVLLSKLVLVVSMKYQN